MKNHQLFQCLDDARAPKSALGASVGIHALLLTFLVLVPLVAPQALRINYRATIIVPPPEPSPPPEPVEVKLRPPVLPPKPAQQQPELVAESLPPAPPRIAAPEPKPRIVETVPQPVPAAPTAPVAPALVDPKPSPGLVPPRPPVVTDVFSGATLPATTAPPTRNVEAAGFGEGGRDAARPGKAEAVTASGFGDATGTGERGRPGKAGGVGAVGGFDTGVGSGSKPSEKRETVKSGGFGAVAQGPKPSASPKAPEPAANEKPVEIVLKPRPDYTDEARKLRIEGEVLLRVLFTSSGEARVIDVIRGLGHGLDENATRAAERIRFKPAERAGQPTDSTAIVHIVFQLAY